jgi:hypothetical protein
MTEENQRKPGVEYSVEGDRIFRDDGLNKEVVARYDSNRGIVEMLPDKLSYRVAVIRHLNDKGRKYTTVGKIGMDTDRSKAPPKPKKSRIEGEKTAAVVEWYAKHFKEEFLAKYSVREMQIRVRTDEFTREERDKTTGNTVQVTTRIPVYETVEGFDYDISKLKSGEQRLIADCKTHLTQKVKPGDNTDAYDDALDARINAEQEAKRKGVRQ